ncbi:MAG: hypothetical protein ACLP6E_00970, partial [Acidimicrobiales bacterium]
GGGRYREPLPGPAPPGGPRDGHHRRERGREKAPAAICSGELVTINQLVDIVEGIAGVKLRRRYDPSAPMAV